MLINTRDDSHLYTIVSQNQVDEEAEVVDNDDKAKPKRFSMYTTN